MGGTCHRSWGVAAAFLPVQYPTENLDLEQILFLGNCFPIDVHDRSKREARMMSENWIDLSFHSVNPQTGSQLCPLPSFVTWQCYFFPLEKVCIAIGKNHILMKVHDVRKSNDLELRVIHHTSGSWGSVQTLYSRLVLVLPLQASFLASGCERWGVPKGGFLGSLGRG